MTYIAAARAASGAALLTPTSFSSVAVVEFLIINTKRHKTHIEMLSSVEEADSKVELIFISVSVAMAKTFICKDGFQRHNLISFSLFFLCMEWIHVRFH